MTIQNTRLGKTAPVITVTGPILRGLRKYGRVEGVFPTGWSRFPIKENVSSEYDVRQEDVRRT